MLLGREEPVGDIRHRIEGSHCKRLGWWLKTTCLEANAAGHEKCQPSAGGTTGDNDLALINCVVRLAQERRGAEVVHHRLDVCHDTRHAGLGGQTIIRRDETETMLLRRRDEVGPGT
jgi:hypothetical protein